MTSLLVSKESLYQSPGNGRQPNGTQQDNDFQDASSQIHTNHALFTNNGKAAHEN
eukprot:CAMPEP_0198152692 /NCGR_PEP_ID=MMETSP1443-20131203/60842_1 /TAXON_ID=186043 /ORGANISM="Entomoneis sp., Strain CCMP2396" /LENGTH=54 /DNA_ID=CAMNT_0043818795 /DNA_START=150 /DNA_END=311 /DNA_ORIENTATION=-